MSPTIADSPREPTFPISEIFGPTIQGEGPDAGQSCYFVRFGGCDYDCSWCDTPYAVKPEEVRKLKRMTRDGIRAELEGARRASYDKAPPPGRLIWEHQPDLVIFSGGNPLLHDLGDLVRDLFRQDFIVAVETQGSRWQDWLYRCSMIVISPKPPSSGMVNLKHDAETADFMQKLLKMVGPRVRMHTALKIVVANEDDYEWAISFHQRYPTVPFYLSALTDQNMDPGEDPWEARTTTRAMRMRFRWLAERVAHDPRAKDAKVGMQMHVLAWGTGRGF